MTNQMARIAVENVTSLSATVEVHETCLKKNYVVIYYVLTRIYHKRLGVFLGG